MLVSKIIETRDYVKTLAAIDTGNTVLIVSSKGFQCRGEIERIKTQLKEKNVLVCSNISSNPQLVDLLSLIDKFKSQPIHTIIAIGGGSVIDAAKVLSFGLVSNNKHELLSLLEKASSEQLPHLELITIPTTSGTGSEVTPFATVWDRESNAKKSLYGVCSDIVILDPTLTIMLPRDITLYSGLDTLSHALESLWNVNRNFISEVYAVRAIILVCNYFPIVLREPNNLEARQFMQQAALLAGLAISITKTAIAHAISYPLTLHFSMPHGLACGFTLQAILALVKSEDLKFLAPHADKVVDLLNSLSLRDEVAKFANKAQIIEALTVELNTSRASNFIYSKTDNLVNSILNSSL
ncbi:phosphonoacetaldehyde reductase [Catenovulum sediminis]|uniref:Phosphonoacetaldehyde reductase n=1 Tax=Catenovulum sediminis TaxID=1740262 RepID=A0ABV1RHI7_9ALTE